MAITTLGLTGFEHGFIGAGAQNGGGLFDAAPGAGWSASTSSPRNGNYCARLVAPANTATQLRFNVPGNPTKLVLRFGIRFLTALPTAGQSQTILVLNSSTPASVLIVSRTTDGRLQFLYGGSITSSFSAITDTNWHLIEFQLDALAKTLDVKIDGVVGAVPLTSSGTITNFASVLLGTNSTNMPTFTADYDDAIIGTWTNAATDWYGDGKVLAQLPGSDGTHNFSAGNFSPGDAGAVWPADASVGGVAYTYVDDPPGTGGWTAIRSTTDNLAGRSSQSVVYLEIKPAPTAEASLANAVRALLSYSSPATQANLFACDVRNSENVVNELWGLTGGVGKAYNIVANQFKSVIVTRPVAGWTASEVNAVRFRFGGPVSGDVNPIPTCQALMLEVDWPIVAAPSTPNKLVSVA
jgi:hypothetical protein